MKRTVEEIQNRRDHVESLCTAHKEENILLHQAINNFLEKHNNVSKFIHPHIIFSYLKSYGLVSCWIYWLISLLQLYSWLVSRGEAFLQGHQDMGSVLAMARDFCEVHQKLIAELQV